MTSFHPAQFSRDLISVSIVFVALIVVSQVAGGPTAGLFDPNDTAHLPRPEWSFQAHYQLLRITPGSMKILATFVLPTVLSLILLALPWIDRGSSRRLADRRLVTGGGIFLIVAIIGLTGYGVASHPPERPPSTAAGYDPIEAGRLIYEKENCKKCHTVGLDGGDEGPDLTGVGLKLQEPYMRKFLRNPPGFIPDIDMPAVKVPEREFNELIAYLKSLREQ